MPDEIKPSVETSIARLNDKIDYNHKEIKNQLDGMTALVGVRLTHVEARMDDFDERLTDNTERLNKIETLRGMISGGAIVISTIIGGAVATFGVWLVDNWHRFFK